MHIHQSAAPVKQNYQPKTSKVTVPIRIPINYCFPQKAIMATTTKIAK
jgi:hypothetical protein